MKVKATQLGYHNHIRVKPGQIFELVEYEGLDREKNPVTRTAEQQFSKKWMVKVEGRTVPTRSLPPAGNSRPTPQQPPPPPPILNQGEGGDGEVL